MSSIAILEAVNTSSVQFHEQPIITAMVAGVAYVAMRPIVENIGINWKGQHVKLVNQMDKFGCGDISIPTKGGIQKMLCIPLRKLNGWLFSINPAKVRADIRDKLIAYQEECFTVLHDYWTKGQTTNPRKMKRGLPGKITPEQQEVIKQLVLTRGKSVPQQYQAKATITLWSALKTHFGCTYKDIGEEQFTEALSLASRIPLEGEVLEREDPQPAKEITTPTNCRILHTYNEFGIIVGAQVAREDEFLTSAQGFAQIARRRGYVMVKAEDFIGLTFK
ncbi:hypothetical protein AL485_18275 [Serratia liquefaciens]|uniref:phage antirepressor N-terminal domain-containing protein n=1 Tax=Serratia liquefaciens TaxID=614 RepID=UPI00076B547A|nr:phage antirepressor N-terminal domain-containing protein [Serratia liquefaciens]AMH00952.1 hypothetical protein AL485_18275 [Serratia liquefaciens]